MIPSESSRSSRRTRRRLTAGGGIHPPGDWDTLGPSNTARPSGAVAEETSRQCQRQLAIVEAETRSQDLSTGKYQCV